MDKSRKNRIQAFTFAELMIALVVISVLSAILYPTIAQFTPNSNKPLFKSAYKIFTETMTEVVNDNGGTLSPSNGASPLLPNITICTQFCNKVNTIRRSGLTNCSQECAPPNRHFFVTSNGMRWSFETDYCDSPDGCEHVNPNPLDGSQDSDANYDANHRYTFPTYKITVDVNASNNNLSQQGVPADTTFVAGCTNAPKGGCGTFKYQYRAVSPANPNGIFAVGGVPNYTLNANNQIINKESFDAQNLKNQDTFEIYIDRTGNIVGMSPAAWANLEDNEATGN